MVAEGHLRRKREAPVTARGVPPHSQRAIPDLSPAGLNRVTRTGDGTAPLVICALVPCPAVTFLERCGRSMRFVGDVQPPPGLVALIGGREPR